MCITSDRAKKSTPTSPTDVVAYQAQTGTTGVNFAINVIQIGALIVFSVIAIAYRSSHPEGSTAWHLVNGVPVDYVVAQEPVLENGKPKALVVKAGISDGQFTEVTGEGLVEGMQILTGVENTKQANGAAPIGATGGRR